jgi:hypothetical protein
VGGVNRDLLGRERILAYCVVDWGASDSYRGLLVTWQESNGWLVQTSSSVDVDSVGDVLCRFRLVDGWMDSFVLPSRCEQQATIRSKRQTPEKGCESLVEVYGSIADAERADAVHTRGVWHDGG